MVHNYYVCASENLLALRRNTLKFFTPKIAIIPYSIQKTSPPFGPSRKSSASITSSNSTSSRTSVKHKHKLHLKIKESRIV